MPTWYPRIVTAEQIDAANLYGDAPKKLLHASLVADASMELLSEDASQRGHCLPWASTASHIRFRAGEVSVWYGYSGHWKSTLLGQVCTGFMAQGARVCIASFEMSPARSLLRMARQASGVREPSAEFIHRFAAWSALWFYDHKGLCRPENVYGLMRYCQTIAVDHIVIDSMMRVVAGEDDYNGQKEFMRNMCSLSSDLQVHAHVVCHKRKGDQAVRGKNSHEVRGSVSITDAADNSIDVWRDRDENVLLNNGLMNIRRPDASIVVTKQRNGEFEGAIPLWIDRESTQFMSASEAKPFDLMTPLH